jgi:uncharacterized protein YegL
MRKLPIYILLDTSGSMRGEPIEAVQTGLQSLLSSLRRDPYALETVHICIITFDREARILCPLTDLGAFVLPQVPPLESSPTNLGEALELLCQRYDSEVVKGTDEVKGDWLPLVVVMTDGSPSDTMLFEDMCQAIKNYRFTHIIGCAAGPKAKTEPLKNFCTDVVALETMDSNAFARLVNCLLFDSIEASICSKTTNEIDGLNDLPPPPPGILLGR